MGGGIIKLVLSIKVIETNEEREDLSMRKHKLVAGVTTLAVTAGLFSGIPLSDVSAAEVTEKSYLEFNFTGKNEKKKIAKADADVINKAFGYDSGSNEVHICSESDTVSIDWENSAIESWQVYETIVFQPVLSRDSAGNLTVGVDETSGSLDTAWDTWATYPTERVGEVGHPESYRKTEETLNKEYKERLGNESADYDVYNDWVRRLDYSKSFLAYWYVDYVLSENHFCILDDCTEDTSAINSHLGITELKTWNALSYKEREEKQQLYEAQNTKITDAYVIRISYTADDIALNEATADKYSVSLMNGYLTDIVDVYGVSHGQTNVHTGSYYSVPYLHSERNARYTDLWILPEGVDTVLNLEDVEEDDTTDDIVTPDEKTTFDFSDKDTQTVSKEEFTSILEANKENDVVIKSNNGVTFTFEKGSMSAVDGKDSYDFSTTIRDTYTDSMPSYIPKSSFVSQIHFNYSGKLPGTANIRFFVGKDYAGQTLYYSLMNEDNTFAEVKSYKVDEEGYLTVKQDHCSTWVVTTTEPKAEPESGETPSETEKQPQSSETPSETAKQPDTSKPTGNQTTSPATGDAMTILPLAVILMAFAAGFVMVKGQKKKSI